MKIITVLLGCILVFNFFFTNDIEAASTNVTQVKSNNDYTLGEIQTILETYLKNNGKNLSLNTQEFDQFATDQLLDDKDKALVNHEKYGMICDFLVYYLQERQNNNDVSKMKNKTIGQISKEGLEEENNVEQIVKENENKIKAFGSSYSVTKAQAYARKWYNGRNRNYNDYSGAGGDCTNYVSQILYSGGKKEEQDRKRAEPLKVNNTTYYWYSFINSLETGKIFRYGRAVSSSWIRVSDFGAYWARSQKVKTYTNTKDVIKNAKPGDVIQFMKNGRSTYFHTMFVYGKSNGTLQLSGHSTDYLKRNIKNISGIKKYRLIKFT